MAGGVSDLVGGWVKGLTRKEMTKSKLITLNLVVNKLCHTQERMGHRGKVLKERKSRKREDVDTWKDGGERGDQLKLIVPAW